MKRMEKRETTEEKKIWAFLFLRRNLSGSLRLAVWYLDPCLLWKILMSNKTLYYRHTFAGVPVNQKPFKHTTRQKPQES